MYFAEKIIRQINKVQPFHLWLMLCGFSANIEQTNFLRKHYYFRTGALQVMI